MLENAVSSVQSKAVNEENERVGGQSRTSSRSRRQNIQVAGIGAKRSKAVHGGLLPEGGGRGFASRGPGVGPCSPRPETETPTGRAAPDAIVTLRRNAFCSGPRITGMLLIRATQLSFRGFLCKEASRFQ